MAVELLAPATNVEIARSAILSGADAVYIGAPSFGARYTAGNSMEDIERLLDFAHLFGVKVYLTMNTILFDSEIEEAMSIARRAEEIGVDALIVQDMAYLKMGLNRISLHASTQTGNSSLEAVRYIENSGFDRVVLERSLTIDEIREIRSNTSIEIETFIHGAMCVGYSGKCYLSHYLCGRSGNRGVCAQPCRSKYNLFTEDGKLLGRDLPVLSVGDLNMSDRLRQLLEAGVTSLKIEGRLKNESYVVNNVSYYSKLLNELSVDRTSVGESTCRFVPNPRKSFFRGFSGHMFLDSGTAKVGSATKSIGEKIGSVISLKGNCVEISCSCAPQELHNGDGLSWKTGVYNQYGAFINSVNVLDEGHAEIVLSSTDRLRTGFELYRNLDRSFHPTFKDVDRKLCRSISVVFVNESELTVSSGDFCRQYAYKYQPSRNSSVAYSNIVSSFTKTGDYPYLIEKVSVEYSVSSCPFLSISALNEMRRDFLSGLTSFILESYKPMAHKAQISDKLSFPKELSYQWNVSNFLSRSFYEEHGSSRIEPALELSGEKGSVSGKTVMVTRHCIRRQMGLCPKENNDIKVALPLILENNGKRLKAVFRCTQCGMILSAE